GLDDRRDDAGLRDDAAHRADRATPGLLRDLADPQLELRRAGERVAARVHRRRARVRGLAAERDEVTLDAEGAEHDAEGQAQRLEHRALLEVQLEIGRRILELRARVESPVEVDAVRGERIGPENAAGIAPLADLRLVVHRARGGRRAEERAP